MQVVHVNSINKEIQEAVNGGSYTAAMPDSKLMHVMHETEPGPVIISNVEETHYAWKIELILPEEATDMCSIIIHKGLVLISGEGMIDLKLNFSHIEHYNADHPALFHSIFLHELFGKDKIHLQCNNHLLSVHIPKQELLTMSISEVKIN